jgi:hypothetical protein
MNSLLLPSIIADRCFFRIRDGSPQIVRPGISGVEAKVTAKIAIGEAPPILPHNIRESAFSGELELALNAVHARVSPITRENR